jgi:hypothetical protein
MKLRSLVVAGSAVAALAAAPMAQADVTGSTPVTGTTTPGLAIIAATPAAFTTFATGTNTTTPSLITVTNSDTGSPNWVLHATDSVSTAAAGRMALTGASALLPQCANAPANLTAPLKVVLNPAGAALTGITALNSSDTTGVALGALSTATAAGSRIASGSGLTAAFPIGFSQTIGGETINAGCSYAETVTFTASAS